MGKQAMLTQLERKQTALISEIMGVNDNFTKENLGVHRSNSIDSDLSQSHALFQGFESNPFGNVSETDVTLRDLYEPQKTNALLDVHNEELCQEFFFDSFEDLRNTSNELPNDGWCLDTSVYH